MPTFQCIYCKFVSHLNAISSVDGIMLSVHTESSFKFRFGKMHIFPGKEEPNGCGQESIWLEYHQLSWTKVKLNQPVFSRRLVDPGLLQELVCEWVCAHAHLPSAGLCSCHTTSLGVSHEQSRNAFFPCCSNAFSPPPIIPPPVASSFIQSLSPSIFSLLSPSSLGLVLAFCNICGKQQYSIQVGKPSKFVLAGPSELFSCVLVKTDFVIHGINH